MTDAPNTDYPDAAEDDADDTPNVNDNDAGYIESKNPPYSLIKRNKYFKNAPNTKKPIKKPLMPPMVIS